MPLEGFRTISEIAIVTNPSLLRVTRIVNVALKLADKVTAMALFARAPLSVVLFAVNSCVS